MYQGDRGEAGVLVRGLEKISRDRLMPLLPKCVAVLAINSSVRGLAHYPDITLSSRQQLRATCAESHNLPSYYCSTAAPILVAFNTHFVQISNSTYDVKFMFASTDVFMFTLDIYGITKYCNSGSIH